MKFTFPFTARQRQVMESPAQILWIGAGTKTGKSAALFCWLIEGLLRGQACAFVGPWFFRSKSAFDQIKVLLEPFIRSREVRINESRLQITSVSKGYIDFQSADNPNAAFGSNYDRVVIDEASRCPREIFPAALTTISATNGKVRAAFNVELGQKNWAIANLLRVQRLSPEERARTGENFLTFPSGGDGLVSPALIELMRSQMPEILWRALYLGEVPTSDCSLFRNLDKVFTGKKREEPVEGDHYVMGVDLARKTDFSVVTIMDNHGNVVCGERFNQISWSLQVERVVLLYRTFRCTKAVVDSTGVGDAIIEQLEAQGLTVEPYIFTVTSRRMLLEELILACDNAEITVPVDGDFKRYREELEAFEYQLDGQTIRYAVPNSMHDDCAFSLALATHAYRASRGAILGVLDLARRWMRDVAEGVRDRFGEIFDKPAPKPVPVLVRKEAAVIRTEAPKKKANDPCLNPDCKSTSTNLMSHGVGGLVVYCNQCHAKDGVLPAAALLGCMPGCPAFVKTFAGGRIMCGNCGRYKDQAPAAIGTSRADYGARRGFGQSYGRFRR